MRKSRKSLYLLCLFALAMVLVLSFASIATAKYAGAFVKGSDTYAGYLSWSGANEVWRANTSQTDPSAQQITAHGGYLTSSTKCAVCHSAHRAYSEAASTVSDPGENRSLTVAGTCVNCHSTWGAGGANKKIEWAQSSPGPHSGFGCVNSCHTAGIHGNSGSEFNGMNAYMLGSDKDAALTEAFTNGNVNEAITYGSTETTGAGWFQNGTIGTPVDMSTPDGVNASQMSAAKSTATGYTCGQKGCHTSGQFVNNVWGFSSMRAGDTTDKDNYNTAMTGHLTTFPMDFGSEYPQCGPCHPGAPAGGYRAVDSAAFDAANGKARAYGCDQCHDVVGRATNTTAWPHGNRNIDVYEWTPVAGDASEVTQTVLPNIESHNLWMYQSSIVADGLPNSTFQPADGTFKVITGATGSGAKVGNINDGACLKCHVAVDQKSIKSNPELDGSKGVTAATEHAHKLYVDGDGIVRNQPPAAHGEEPVYPGSVFTPDPDADYTGTSTQIFLWK